VKHFNFEQCKINIVDACEHINYIDQDRTVNDLIICKLLKKKLICGADEFLNAHLIKIELIIQLLL